MTVEVELWPQVTEDFRELPTDKLRWEAMRYLMQLRDKPFLGQPLFNHPVLGDLSDCRKIFLDETHDADPRWRIIYRLLPSEQNPVTADVIIIGPREDDAVYHEVMARLERPTRFANPS